MEKLRWQLDNAVLEFAESCAEAYEELFGGDLTVISSEYIHEDSYYGYEMQFRGKEFISEQGMINFQSACAEELNKTMDFKITSNNEFEMFVMVD